jgi:pimeloyl-ACP methyl ester carboxylesterase
MTQNAEVDERRLVRILRRAAGVSRVSPLFLLFWITGCASVENSLVFQPRPLTEHELRAENASFENAEFQAADGTQLHGWFVAPENPRAVVLYCHGNAGNVASRRPLLRLYRDYLQAAILVFDYRGYGKSQGAPSEAGVLSDARAARRWLAKRMKIPESEIVIVGNSLGGAVAVDLAARDGAAGLVLENTFTSLADVAKHQAGGLPVHWLMMNRFDSEAKLVNYRGPLLQTHGTADEVVPYALGHRLFRAANEIETVRLRPQRQPQRPAFARVQRRPQTVSANPHQGTVAVCQTRRLL